MLIRAWLSGIVAALLSVACAAGPAAAATTASASSVAQQTGAASAVPKPAPAASVGAGALIPLSTFARHASLALPRLSPDGKHLAVRMDYPDGQHHAIAIYTLANMKIASILRLPIYIVPVNMVWANDQWLVVAKGKLFGSLDAPSGTGEIIATNVDGSKQTYLYGYHNYGHRSSTRQPDQGFGYIVGRPDKPNGHVYIRSALWDGDRGHSAVYDIDATTEARHLIADINVDNMSFLIGPKGKATYAYGANNHFKHVAYQRVDGNWVALNSKLVGERFEPFAYAPDHQHVYALYSASGGPMQLVKASLDGSKRTLLASNPFASVGGVQWTSKPHEEPFAVNAEAGRPEPIFIHPNLPDAKIYRALQTNFPTEFVDFINYSEDGSKLLFGVASDRDPGTYYLINTKTFKVRKLFAVAPWVHPKQMAKRLPFRFKNRDGVVLDGFLTMPPGRGKTNLPMVLVPHGGPFTIRDTWFYDFYAQFLASRGYLVLQVNYRGSGGRGVNFVHSGYRKWGTGIQQDLIDGVKWAIKNKYADANRVCVFGGSFGGYSALMIVVRAPKMFKCAIGYSGVYDLHLIFKHDRGEFSQNYFKATIGTGDAMLDANSPDKQAAKITVPVFLAHGKADQTAPFAQAEAMRDAFNAIHKKFEWMAVPKEGHGFYTQAHREELFKRMQAFLAKYIGPGVPIKTTP